MTDLERALQKALADLVGRTSPVDDWACVRCGGGQPVAGFSCAYHRAVDVLDRVKGRKA